MYDFWHDLLDFLRDEADVTLSLHRACCPGERDGRELLREAVAEWLNSFHKTHVGRVEKCGDHNCVVGYAAYGRWYDAREHDAGEEKTGAQEEREGDALVPRYGGDICRGLSRHVGACRTGADQIWWLNCVVATCRDLSRRVAARRDSVYRPQFNDLRNVPLSRQEQRDATMPTSNRRELTLQEAKAAADRMDAQHEQWDAQADANSWDNRVAVHYRRLGPTAVVCMWEAGVNEKGLPLSKFELAALVEKYCEVFGCLPPSDSSTPAPTTSVPVEPEPEGTDMMTRADVARKRRASVSSVQRMEKDGRLPKATRLGARGRRHLVRDVDAFIEKLDEQRHAPRKA